MEKSPKHAPVAPELAVASYDFNALHDALAKGKTAEQAAAAALIEPKPAPAPAKGQGEPNPSE